MKVVILWKDYNFSLKNILNHFTTVAFICVFWGGFMQILLVCLDFFKDTIKYYNKICTSQWRKDLLNLGFTEILGRHTTLHKGGVATLQHFKLQGIYENMPLQIKSAGQYYDTIEISIPLNLKIDKDTEIYQKILVKSISIEDATEDKIIWAIVHVLQNNVNLYKYQDQKLVNYLKFEEL